MVEPQPNDGFEWTQERWGAALHCTAFEGIATHLFTVGNLRLVDDQREWSAVAERMGVSCDGLRLIQQVHGTAVEIVRPGTAAPVVRPTADIIISDDPSAAVAVRVADCAPVLLADRRLGAVGAAHAGWRGTLQRAAARAVEAMIETFGSRPRDLVAAVGPCLGACCGEVGPEVVEQFRAAAHPADDLRRWFKAGPSGRPHLDLWRANRDQLERAGIPAASIHIASLCTKSYPATFHSYRSHGPQAGRMAGVVRAGRGKM